MRQPSFVFSQGICFIRTSRPESAVIYTPDEKFEVGVAKVRGTLLHAFGIQKASGQCAHWF